MKLLSKLVTIAALSAPLTFAPLTLAQDISGNSLLKGSYRFRYVAPAIFSNYSASGAIAEVLAAEGVITFDGAGNYIIEQGSQWIDNTQNSGKPQEFPIPSGGTYALSAAGIGYIQSPLASIDNTDFGGVFDSGTYSNGIFTASATESAQVIQGGQNDLFVAMLVGTPPTNSSFTSPYWIGALDFSGGGDLLLKNALLEIHPNGSGGLGTLSITGQTYNQTGALSQTVNGATYNFAADGGATLTLPLPSNVTTAHAMFSGSRLMYVSADGNFVLGWNPNGYDIFFGVKALTAPPPANLFQSGLYYLGNLSDLPLVVKSNTIESGCGAESYYGMEVAAAAGEIIHQRYFAPISPLCSSGAAIDLGLDDYLLTAINSDGTVNDGLGNSFAFGASSIAFVSVSNSLGYFSLTIGIQAPSLSGSGVYLNPIGVFNGANWDPITAGLAPGELITLFGTNLSSSKLTNIGGSPFGTSLGGVQVLVNGQPAPVYYVSPTQVSAIMPYVTSSSTSPYATIQVNNGGLLSNQITVFLTPSESGIFSQGENGIGDAIALHADYSAVSAAHPAQPGETIIVALTGMGTVTPAVADGAVGPSNPLSTADVFSNANELLVLFNDYNQKPNVSAQATVQFAGLYPTFAGLYQMNVTVPTNVGPGEVYIEVVTAFADVEQVTIPVGTASGAAQVQQSSPALVPALRLPHRQRVPRQGTTGLTPSAQPGIR